MTSSPGEPARRPGSQDTDPPDIDALAEDLIALVEEFETAISQGSLSPRFAERLAELRRATERLVGR